MFFFFKEYITPPPLHLTGWGRLPIPSTECGGLFCPIANHSVFEKAPANYEQSPSGTLGVACWEVLENYLNTNHLAQPQKSRFPEQVPVYVLMFLLAVLLV